MKISAAFVALSAFFAVAQGAEFEKRAKNIDVDVVQFALTLEHLEAAFYAGGLKKFSKADFHKAGYPNYVRQRISELANEEATHVAVLSSVLGKSAVKACKYDFPYDTVDGFLGLAGVLESVGVSAYLGAAPAITSKDYLTAAASIYGIEARHQAIISEFEGTSGSPTSFETPLDPSQVYTLAAPFIKSCPKSNPDIGLGLKVFPALTAQGNFTGGTVKLSFKKKKGVKHYYAHVLAGLADTVIKVCDDDKIKFPKGIEGQGYIVISSSKTLTDKTTIAGPFPFNNAVKNVK